MSILFRISIPLVLSLFVTSAFCQAKKEIKSVLIGKKIWMAENLSGKTQLGIPGREICFSSFPDDINTYLLEDAKTARKVASEKGTNVNQALMKGTWGQYEAISECDYDFDKDMERFAVDSKEWNACMREMKYLQDGLDLLGFAAVGYDSDDFELGSVCREGCGGPDNYTGNAKFWSSSGKIISIEQNKDMPTLKNYPPPKRKKDDCGDGFGNFEHRTKFSLQNVGKTVASVRCVKD